MYLEEHAGPDVTDRFMAAVRQSFETLARLRRASCAGFANQPCAGYGWPVNGFENWLIFNYPKRYGVEIVHIVHGARDIESLLDT